MPHPNNDNWISLLAGRPVKAVPANSIDEIPAQRMRTVNPDANKNLPEMAEVYEKVIIRESDGFALTAEIYVPKGEGPFPVFLYRPARLHGGGWCVGTAERVRAPAMRIASNGDL